MCQIWEHSRDNLRVALEIARDQNGSTLREWNVNEDSWTEHDRRNALFQAYVYSDCGDRREVATAIRPHLESFLRVAHPTYYPPGTKLGTFIDRCNDRANENDPILDYDRLKSLTGILEFANKFHHDSNPNWATAEINDQELLGFVQATLEFTSR